MQLLLGLSFFSILLTAGNCLSCEQCMEAGSDCSGPKNDCGIENAVCMTVTMELTVGINKVENTVKSCSAKNICKGYEDMKGKTSTSQIGGIPAGGVIKRVVCSRAPPSFASFFPAFLGLLLMKLLC